MGEAKLRGSFEERKAMAAERERKARLERAKRSRYVPEADRGFLPNASLDELRAMLGSL